MIEWSGDERRQIIEAGISGRDGGDAALRTTTRAVKLVAARGGTMASEIVLSARLSVIADPATSTAMRLKERREVEAMFTAQGARVAVLEAENARLRQERHDALSAKTTEGLSAAEWQLRTGTAERERDEWQRKALERDLQVTRLQAAGDVLSKRVDEQAEMLEGADTNADLAEDNHAAMTKGTRYP